MLVWVWLFRELPVPRSSCGRSLVTGYWQLPTDYCPLKNPSGFCNCVTVPAGNSKTIVVPATVAT